jgi:V8-like Glu-specific endopeptidase
LAGLKNDPSRFQYDAPTQFGNSGGPLLDFSGNIVGVIVSGLDDAKTQTINFAVKSYLVEGFLSSNNVSFEKAESTEELKLPDIAEKAERFTVLVGCWE